MHYPRSKEISVFSLLWPLFLFLSCSTEEKTESNSLFTLLGKNHTNIDFVNNVEYTEEYNTYTYRNFYNGAGVGITDLNGDNLPDIYFCGNMAGNRLYVNKGDFVFEDVTDKAGVKCSGSWSTGVSIADVNSDGLPDIYVCKSGRPDAVNRRNELFINNGDLTFTEKAGEYGLDILGLSNHATFFDFDRDGDLDCYLLNNSFQSVTEFDIKPGQREIRDTLGGNKLFRNDGGSFTDVSEETGIYGSKIGFGLGVSIGDVNRDGWPDMYVANDFFERDYLYINNGGSFTESLESYMSEISLGAMGADIADLNNDAWPEIFVTEMTPDDFPRYRTKTVFENWDRYRMKVKNGYYHQFPRNTLQLNNRNKYFSETGRFSGVSATDWSWGALIFDMDNDGWKDIFVANGIYKDLLDRDFLDMYSDPSVMRSMIRTEKKAILQVISQIPSVKIPNYAFLNNHDLTFTNKADESGLGLPSWSNGAAYGDLDNDGDLDLVVNNVNMEPFVYRNETVRMNGPGYLSVKLEGRNGNTFATGSAVTLYYEGKMNYQELLPCRGFQSNVDNRLVFGIGNTSRIDSLTIIWPDGFYSVIINPGINKLITVSEKDISVTEYKAEKKEEIFPVFRKSAFNYLPEFYHRENDFNDFERDRLIFRMLSNEGPAIAVDDVNGDGLDDLYASNARDASGKLFFQDNAGRFRNIFTPVFETDRISEDTGCAFFDADGDSDNDLYVATGGNEFPTSSSALSDRMYLNDGKGRLSLSEQLIGDGQYDSNSCVVPADFDNDGDADLFVGTRHIPFSYGISPASYLLENDGKGKFRNVNAERAPELSQAGMVTDMVWADIDNDNDLDMLIAGEWMSLKVMVNQNGKFIDISDKAGLKNTGGFWHKIAAKDLNGDGLMDFILGNDGLNSRFCPDPRTPMTMFVNDFDLNGTVEQIICWSDGSKTYPLAMKDDLIAQIPSLRKKYVKFEDYRNATIEDIFTPEVLARSVRLTAVTSITCVLLNKGNNRFEVSPLPSEAQFTPVYAIMAEDFNKDGICDILLGGNQYREKPELGIHDAGYGLLLKGEAGMKWKPLSPEESGIFIKGEIKDFEIMKVNKKNILVVAINNGKLQYYEF